MKENVSGCFSEHSVYSCKFVKNSRFKIVKTILKIHL